MPACLANYARDWPLALRNRGGIYAIRHVATGRLYIGSAAKFTARWSAHLWQLRHGSHHSVHLQRAFTKYGQHAFEFEIIEYVDDKEQLVPREQVWLDFFKPALNTSPTASCVRGVKRTDAQRKAISDKAKGRVYSAEYRANMSVATKGKKVSDETRARISAARKGWKFTAETLARMSAAQKLRRREQDAKGRFTR